MRFALPLLFVLSLACVRTGDPGLTDRRSRHGEPQPARFAALDRDRDGVVDREEHRRVALAYHGAWDIDQDGRIHVRELSDAVFETLDADGDGRVTHAELEARSRALFPRQARDAARWDTRADAEIDRREMIDGLRALEVFAAYDRDGDGSITDLELADALLAIRDGDGDGALDRREWDELPA